MKTLKLFLVVMGIGLCSLSFYSCLDDGDETTHSLNDRWLQLVTIVPDGENAYYLRADDGKTFWPAVNYNGYRPKEQTRALVDYTILSDEIGGFDHYVKINFVDERLTKAIAEDRGEENDVIYGTDPVNIAKHSNGKDYIWIGDGYLNLYFEAYFGGTVKHFVNLVNTNPEDPYELEFRHHAYDDPKSHIAVGFVAFDLRSLLSTDSEMKPGIPEAPTALAIKVKTPDGDKTYNVEYHPNNNERMNAKTFDGLVMTGLK